MNFWKLTCSGNININIKTNIPSFLFKVLNYFYMQNPDFLDINANSSELHVLIEKIQITVNELEALVLSCNLYERKLKVIFLLLLNINLMWLHIILLINNLINSIFLLLWVKLEITRFDLLEETTAKFRLILLLWNSVEEWDCLENKWQQVRIVCACKLKNTYIVMYRETYVVFLCIFPLRPQWSNWT